MTVAFPNLAAKPWALRLSDEFKSGACHAGQFETSIVMAERPELVRDAIRETLPPNPASISRAIREGKRDFDGRGRAAGLLRVSGTGHCRGGPRDGRDPRSDPGRRRFRRSSDEGARRRGGGDRGGAGNRSRHCARVGRRGALRGARRPHPRAGRAADRRAGRGGPAGAGGGLRRHQRSERAGARRARPRSWVRSRCWSTTPAPPPRCRWPGPRSRTGIASSRSTPPALSSVPGPFCRECWSGSGAAWSTSPRPRV